MAEVIAVAIGRTKVRMPVIESREFTEAIARRVTERLAEMEEKAERVDTQGFALRAAFEFAAEAALLREEQRDTERDLVRAIDGIADRIGRIVTAMEGE